MKPKAIKTNREQGITIILSVVLLGTVTFVSFAVSTLIIREIVETRLVLRTEPAISAAESGVEVGLYNLLRGTGSLTISDTPTSQSGASYSVNPDLYDDPYQFKFNCGSGTTEFWVGLYNAEDSNMKNANYRSFTITNTGNCPIKYRVFSWTTTSQNLCGPSTVNPRQPPEMCVNLNAIDGDDRYIIAIQTLGSSGQIASGSIAAKKEDNTNQGVPSQTPQLFVTGKSGDTRRRIEVLFP